MVEKPALFNVKLMPGVGSGDILSKTQGVLNVTPLFPGEADEELSTIYTIEVDPSNADALVEAMRKDKDIEYIEELPVRKLR